MSKPERHRYLDRKQSARTLAALRRKVRERPGTWRWWTAYAWVGLALGTAMRAIEFSRLDWGDVDWTDNHLVLRETKSGEPQTVPLTPTTRALLVEHEEWMMERGWTVKRGDPVFRNSRGDRMSTQSFRTLFTQHIRRIGDLPERMTAHALRHGACTQLLNETRDLYVVKEIARHANISTTMRYAHWSDEIQARAVEGLDRVVGSLL